MKRIGFVCNEELYEATKATARAQGISMSDLIRISLKENVKVGESQDKQNIV